MRKVRISARRVVHKYVELDVYVPNTIKDADVEEWLIDNTDIYNCRLENKFIDAEYQKGFGINIPIGMSDKEAAEECRYDIILDNVVQLGGHL
jgi:hypothetical protein